MKPRFFGLAASLLCLAAGTVSAQTLSVGDDAPPLTVSKWIKGEKVEKLEADRTYVVEFWATWCGPCLRSIPHLSQLQQDYQAKNVRFLGISVWEENQDKVAPFVEKMGDKMGYTVALDEVAEGAKGNSGKMAEDWMAASASDGIPTAFIVAKGKIAWIGHPMAMDQPLARITSGDFDLAKAAIDYREEKAIEQKIMAVFARLRKLGGDVTEKERLAVLDEAIQEKAGLEKHLGLQKYLLMAQSGDESAPAYGSRLVDGALKGEAESLNQLAWSIVDPENKEDRAKRDFPLARKAAVQADELTHHENGPILDTLALVYFETGDPDKALSAQEKAVKLMGDANEEVKARLTKYRKAVAEKQKP